MDYQLIAHRCYSAIAPENTLSSFRLALEESIFGVEFDVHLAADGVPIIIHDTTVDRTTNGTGKVAEKSLAQLQSLDAGSWFHPRFSQERIPTLPEVLDLFSNHFVTLYIEVKFPETWTDQGINNLVYVLNSWRDRCVILSFDHDFLGKLRRIDPHFTLGYGMGKREQYTEEYLPILDGKQGIILPHFSLILENPSLTRKLLEKDYEIITWTVDDIAIAQKLANLNVTKIITNNLLQD